jgi:hypothetical protein
VGTVFVAAGRFGLTTGDEIGDVKTPIWIRFLGDQVIEVS